VLGLAAGCWLGTCAPSANISEFCWGAPAWNMDGIVSALCYFHDNTQLLYMHVGFVGSSVYHSQRLAIEIALHKSCAKNVAGFTGDRIFSKSQGIWHIVYGIL
jgi:hypothetical protein